MDENIPPETTAAPPDDPASRIHVASAGQTSRTFAKKNGRSPTDQNCRPGSGSIPRGRDSAKAHLFVRILNNFMLGLAVLGGELRWLILNGLRTFELRQLEKRLYEEYAALGKAVAEQGLARQLLEEAPDTAGLLEPDNETVLALRQIDFLGQEITLHKEERLRLRQEFIERRRRLAGTPPER